MGKQSTVWDRLRQELESQETVNQQWNPEPGDILLGTLLETKTVEGGEYGPTRLAEVQEAETGRTVAVWLKHKILQKEWDKQKPQPGDHLGIKYLGEQAGGQGGSYHAYILKVERAGGK